MSVQARQEKIKNYKVLSLHKLTPPATRAILDAGEVHLDGIICPGHVSAIIGSKPYESAVRDYGVACVVTGFETLDILQGIQMLTHQLKDRHYSVEIAYKRAVRPEGNLTALRMMAEVFEITSVSWRGFGTIANSGLKLRPEFHNFDAEATFDLPSIVSHEPRGCLCGAVLRGVRLPGDCKLFGSECTPEQPVGPCMVSSEGACSAYYLYGEPGE
jgi:hydrogenase expression/formation protein HypD